MKYDFNEVINRYETSCLKWDFAKRKFGEDDVIPFWIADSDFSTPPEVIDRLVERVRHGIFGYSERLDSYYEAIIRWMDIQHNWKIKKEWITSCPGVVPALNFLIQALTAPGDKIIVQSPVYDPFYRVIENNNRTIVNSPLKLDGGKYFMDLEDLTAKIDDSTKMMILCSPHNPVGRVWTKEELDALCEILMSKGIILVSDEIHMDLVYRGHKHTSVGTLSEKILQNAIICTAPSKTFNLAGLQASNIIIPNPEYKEKFLKKLDDNGLDLLNSIGIAACEAAYSSDGEWLKQMLDYLEENVDYVDNFLKEQIPQIKLMRPEGTYLLWLDCSGLGYGSEELINFMHKKARIGVNSGSNYGEGGEHFIRFNIACPRELLHKGLKRLAEAVNSMD